MEKARQSPIPNRVTMFGNEVGLFFYNGWEHVGVGDTPKDSTFLGETGPIALVAAGISYGGPEIEPFRRVGEVSTPSYLDGFGPRCNLEPKYKGRPKAYRYQLIVVED